MGTSDNTHVSNLKCRHYLMYFFCVGLFYYLMSCHLCCFSCRGHDRLRPNDMNLCSKPQTTCCTPRRNRFETVRQNIYIFLRGRSFSNFKLAVCSLILNLWIPQNEKKDQKHQSTAVLSEVRELNGSWAVVLDILDFLKIWDKRLVLGELPLRYPVGFFGTFSQSWEPSYPASYHEHIPGFFFFFFLSNCWNTELRLCQCRGHWHMLSGVAMLHILNFNGLCECVYVWEFED